MNILISKSQETIKYDVFISHDSDSSLDFVEHMAELFEEEGITCWYAPRNLDNTGAGKEFDDEIACAIQASCCMVVVLNDAALESKWVKREVWQADKQNKMVIPFAVSELSFNKGKGLRMRFDVCHIIKAYPEPEKKIPVLLKNVKQFLGHDVSGISIQEEDNDSVTPINHLNEFDMDFEEGRAYLEVNQDKEAFISFLCSAENGNDDAGNELVEIEQRNSKNTCFLDDDIWERIEELSDQGKGYADLLMHFKYYSMGTQNEVALKYLMRSMKKFDSPIAFLQLGICYGWGLGIKLSDVLSRHYFEKSLEKGCGEACRYLGQLYLYGGENIEKDLEKAEKYLKKGMEMKANRCFRMLYQLYCAEYENEKARELVQQMIDQNIKGGCSLMGDYYRDVVKDLKQAEEWYKKAIRNKENDAWGSLALLLLNNGDREEALRLANKGYWENDSNSFFALGVMYEQDGKIAEAWDYYYEEVLRFGTGAASLGSLYFNYDYLPDGFELSDLKHILEISARMPNLESIKCLLRIILRAKGKDTVFCYENIKDVPETYTFVRLGAKEDADLQFAYGRLLLESEGKMHNPYVGIDFVERASVNGNPEATMYAINYYRKHSDPMKISKLSQYVVNCNSYVGQATRTVIDHYNGENDETYVKWLCNSLRILVYEDTKMFFDCFIEFQNAIESSKGEVESWLNGVVDEFFGFDASTSKISMPFYAYLLAVKLSMEKENRDEKILTYIRNEMDVIVDIEAVSKVHYFKDNIQLIWPDYSEDSILNGDFSNERDLRIFYGIKNESLLDVLDGDCSTITDIAAYLSKDAHYPFQGIMGLDSTKTKAFFNSYLRLLSNYQKLRAIGAVRELEEKYSYDLNRNIVCLCCSIGDVLQFGLNSLKMMIVSRDSFGEQWQEIEDNLGDANRLYQIVKKVSNATASDMLMGYCNFITARDELLLFDIQLEHSISNAYVADTINAIISELDHNNVQHELKRVTEESIPESIKDMKSSIRGFAATLRKYLQY